MRANLLNSRKPVDESIPAELEKPVDESIPVELENTRG
jgi:hypothetical protein